MSSRRSRPSSPGVSPDRSAARKGALDLRGLRTLAREHRSGIFGATTGGLAGSHLIPLVGRAMVLAFSCRLPHQLLFVLFLVLHIQISRGLNPVLVHLDGKRPDQAQAGLVQPLQQIRSISDFGAEAPLPVLRNRSSSFPTRVTSVRP